ncbi:leucyl/phenylalanyl-tRNA--protein transferase [Aliarcobacter cryaerophilus]|uniref:leucyl/phenylalanyl-tRNA--protein transferase n=1 Tax=Aliarcobacter cryaerophilus TaxID=28198 RepID=UPI003DA4F3A7
MKLLDIKEKIWLLDEKSFDFPKLEDMENDLVAIGGDFHPQRLLNAYENGLFPWFIDDYNYINWYSPKKRMVLYPDDFKVSKSLKKSILNRGFEVKSNTNFIEVMQNCKNTRRKHESDTWIDDNFIKAYTLMHNLEFANSIEVYLDKKLVGGLYGLIINNIFCGESMFSLVNDASKVAFFHLCEWAKNSNIKLIDCQVYNKHLESLGAYEISREEYFRILKS